MLVLLCGIYHISPEKLIGLEDLSIDPLIITENDTGVKANFIIVRLNKEAPELLCAFLEMAGYSTERKEKLADYIAACVGIKVLHGEKLVEKIDKKVTNEISKKLPDEIMDSFRKDGLDTMKFCFMEHGINHFLQLNKCWITFNDLEITCPNLLDAYASVVIAGKSKYAYFFKYLIDGGFMSFQRN